MNHLPLQGSFLSKRARGTTLIEVMFGLVLSSMLLALTGSLWFFGSHSLVAVSDYTDLDARSRSALDLMSQELRHASQVTGFQNNATIKWLQVTNLAKGTAITYTWNATPRTLVCRKTGEPDQVYLTECDRWDFELCQPAPPPGGS